MRLKISTLTLALLLILIPLEFRNAGASKKKVRRPSSDSDDDFPIEGIGPPDLDPSDAMDAADKIENAEYKINGTKVADKVLAKVRKNIKKRGFNKIHTPNQNFTTGSKTIYLENGTMVGLGNVYRVGDVITTVRTSDTKFRSAYAFYNVTGDSDVQVKDNLMIAKIEKGHVHLDVDNVTIYSVYRYEYVSGETTLDEFEVFVGQVKENVTGLGNQTEEDNERNKKMVAKMKGPMLKSFNTHFKRMMNTALKGSANTAKYHG